MMKMSQEGLDKLSEWEGEVVENNLHMPYDDDGGAIVRYGNSVKGYLTIGHGHLLTRDELSSEYIWIDDEWVWYWDGITDKQATWLFDKDLDWAEEAVNNGIQVPLEQKQFEALVSFTFNVGPTAFKNSTLLKELNAGNYDEVPNQLKRWNRSGGRVVQGLINRRQKEIDYWNDA